MEKAHLAWSKGGEAELAALDGDRVRLRSTASSAPGARIEGALRATGTAIRVKVARCRLREEGEHPGGERIYEIEGRLIDATRGVRAELTRLVSGEAREPAKATEPREATEPVKATEPREATEPAKATEPREATEPAKATEPREATEPAKATEPREATEPAKATEPAS
jgi:hypothetical protein